MSETPLHDKLQEAQSTVETLAGFLEWLKTRDARNPSTGRINFESLSLCNKRSDDNQGYYPLSEVQIARVIGEYTGIDYDELQAEAARMTRTAQD